MTRPTETSPPPTDGGEHVPGGRIAFERLRERTDELELIISGLLAFALLTAPGRIFDAWARNSAHADGVLDVVLHFAFLIGVGLCYSLAFAFISHLAIRGYWVSLIGLKSTFPAGIRWDRVPLIGVVSRPFYEKVVGDLGEAIDRADRAASILFAMTILVALLMVWIGVLAIAGLLLGGLFGALFEDSERATELFLLVTYALFMALTVLPLLLEKVIARRQAAGHPSPRLQRVVHALLRMMGFIIPQRLISPVQLTLQSNLPTRGFMVVYFVVIVLAMALGGIQVYSSASFSMLDRYDVVTGESVDHGMLGAHYESMRSEHDVLLRMPMIPSDRISEAHLRLFIPHRPKLDNALARERCGGLKDARNEAKGDAAARQAVDCLAALWTVTLDGQPVALDGFVPIERRDLGLRGVVGYLPIAGLAPGRHDLALTWNRDGEDSGMMRRREYRIPFWFTPGIELGAAAE